jgi:hypothetical protein
LKTVRITVDGAYLLFFRCNAKTQGHRCAGAALSGQTRRRSIFRMRIGVSHPQRAGHWRQSAAARHSSGALSRSIDRSRDWLGLSGGFERVLSSVAWERGSSGRVTSARTEAVNFRLTPNVCSDGAGSVFPTGG